MPIQFQVIGMVAAALLAAALIALVTGLQNARSRRA